jgi:hypothetical protein
MNARDHLIGYALVALPNEPAFAKCEQLADAFRAEVLREAVEAARSEYLHEDTGTPEDEAYNQGVSDAVAAIGALTETAPSAPVPDNTTAVACTCLGGPTPRDGLHSGYCDTVVHAPWTPQREAAIRATAKEGAGSLHSALGATVPNEDVLGLFAELDRVRAELARRTPTGDETAVEYGVRRPNGEVLTPTIDRTAAEAWPGRLRDMHPTAVLVQRTVRYGAWTEVTS